MARAITISLEHDRAVAPVDRAALPLFEGRKIGFCGCFEQGKSPVASGR